MIRFTLILFPCRRSLPSSPRPSPALSAGRGGVSRRALAPCVLLGLGFTGLQAAAQQPASPPARERLWFDPTQLPRFTGAVERYLPSPAGGFDSLILREGVQLLFPAEEGEAIRRAIPAGRPILAWGIRARSAPVITVLAWAPSPEEEPRFVERPSWWSGAIARGGTRQAVSGTVKQPLYNSRGEVSGALLEDGTVVRVAVAAAAARQDLFRPGAHLAAAGPGVEGEGGRALIAEALGENPQAMTPLPPPRPEPATPVPRP